MMKITIATGHTLFGFFFQSQRSMQNIRMTRILNRAQNGYCLLESNWIFFLNDLLKSNHSARL